MEKPLQQRGVWMERVFLCLVDNRDDDTPSERVAKGEHSEERVLIA